MSADHPYQSTTTGVTDEEYRRKAKESTSAKDQAQQAAGTAADESKHVAGVARDEAQKVASEARSQVNNLMSEATSQVADQTRTQRDRIVETLRTFGDDLDKMATQGEGGWLPTWLGRGPPVRERCHRNWTDASRASCWTR